MAILVCGSLAYDTIMVFPDRFENHILPDKIHILNVAFLVPDLRREYGGTAGNIAYNLRLLDEDAIVMGTVGHDFGPYEQRMRELGLPLEHVRCLDDQFTAQAFITTDVNDNQITAFHPGAMSFAHLNRVADVPNVQLAIVSPDGRQGMLEHSRDLAAQGIAHVFDPGQGLPMFSGPELEEMIGRASVLAVNDYEAAIVEEKTGRGIAELARTTRAVFITHGSAGCVVLSDGGEEVVPAVAADSLVDPTGCGDAFRAGVLYGMARSWEWRKCAQLGAVMGSIKIEHRGGQNHRPTREMIEGKFREAFAEAM